MANQRVMTIDIVYEPLPGSTSNRLSIYLMQGLTTAFPGLRNANVAMCLRDGDGTVVRTVTFGNPSEEMKRVDGVPVRSDRGVDGGAACMTNAPPDRKLARIVRDTAQGSFAVNNERAMLFGPRGEVREVFAPGDPAFLAARERMIRAKELSAVVYLRAAGNRRTGSARLRRVLHEGKRSVHLLLVQLEDAATGRKLQEKDLDQWVQKHYVKKGDAKETPEK